MSIGINIFGILAVIFSLYILDLHDRLNPKIILTTDKGVTVTNISKDGIIMKKQFLPKVDLGR